MAKPFYSHTPLGIFMVQNGISVNELSYMTRINTRQLGHYLKGDQPFSPDHLRRIAQAIEVDPRDIFVPAAILRDISPHQDHAASRRATNIFRPYPGAEEPKDSAVPSAS